jgi:subtilisin family serine protease
MTSSPRPFSARWIIICVVVIIVAALGLVVLLTSRVPAANPPTPTLGPTSTATASATLTPVPLPTRSPTPTIVFKPLTITLTPPPALSDLATQFPELADILNDPELNTVYKDFLIAYQQGGVDAAIALARQRGILTPQNEIRATLVLDTPYTDALTAQLEKIGVIVESAYQTQIDIAVPVELIQRTVDSGHPDAIFKQLTELQHVINVKVPVTTSPGSVREKPQADITGEGVALIGADRWHDAGITGQGIKVGILDCGFKNYKDLLGSELPQKVVAKTFVRGLNDPNASRIKHGTAVAEIIHEVAPDAQLFLADYGCRGGPVQGNAVKWLLDQGVQIISNSTGNAIAPMDGNGWDDELVQQAADQGVLWVNSAGNSATQHWRGPFRDEDGNQIHEFEGGHETLPFLTGDSQVDITLRWNDWRKVDQDFDLYLLDKEGNIVASSREAQTGEPNDQIPIERIQYDGLTPGEVYYILIKAANAKRPAMFDLYVDGLVELAQTTADHSIITPADARPALAVGAVDWHTDRITDYSSRGPTDDNRIKPDIAAPAEVSNFTYQDEGGFSGTSAAAPHVAGAAALVWSANPNFDRQQVWDYLISHVRDYGPPGRDNDYGAGRLQLPEVNTAAPNTPAPPATGSAQPKATSEATATLPPVVNTPLPPATAMPVITSDQSGLPLTLLVVLLILVIVAAVVVIIFALRRPASPPRSSMPSSGAPPLGGQPVAGQPSAGSPPALAPRPPYEPPTQPAGAALPSTTPCPHCGQPVRVGARFCAACGQSMMPQEVTPLPPPPQVVQPPAPVSTTCKNCHQPLRPGAKFCAKCGAKQ